MPWRPPDFPVAVMLALPALIAVLLAAACGGPPFTGSPDAAAAREGERTSLVLQDEKEALRQDAEMYAREYDIPTDEAVRRLMLQDDVGRLGAELRKNERETFAEIELLHEPEYRVIAYFTRDGEKTIQPYTEGTPLENMVEVEQVGATLQELSAAQEEAMRIADDLDIPVGSGIDITRNRAELYVPDRTSFRVALQEAGVELPENVAVIGPKNPPRPPEGADPEQPSSTGPDVFFPRQAFGGTGGMMALAVGELVLDDGGCLRLDDPETGYDIVPVWPADFGLNTEGGEIRVLDRKGRVVGKVGEKVELGGGSIAKGALEGNDLMDEKELRELFGRCPGSYWLVTGD